MKRQITFGRTVLAILVLSVTPAAAIVGGGAPMTTGVARSVVTITGARGNICSGVLIAPTIVLTAGHCVVPGSTYQVVDGDPANGRTFSVKTVALHPQFDLQTMLAHRATADIALLWLTSPVTTRTPAAVGAPRQPILPGSRFTVAGIGVTISGTDSGIGITHVVSLAVTGQPSGLQLRLVDPLTANKRPGLGACTGDSGSPVFEEQGQNGAVIVGVTSWSTGPNNADGCGGLTGVTPLTLYRDWVVNTARSWGARF